MAAMAAASFVHPKLQAITHAGDPQQPIELEIDNLELDHRLIFLFTPFREDLTDPKRNDKRVH